MTANWYFRPMGRGEISVDPIQREFFTTEALDGPADAIVRETIQNSLDAGQPGKKIRVRFFLSGEGGKLPYSRVAPFFRRLWPHVSSDANGLVDSPNEGDDVPFLAVEDFQTRGLTGDPSQAEDIVGGRAKNDFYYFWRNVGRSGKGEKDRGRWGLGKTVFPASSRVQTFFGLTVRKELPSSLLMGQSVLKTHQVDGQRCAPYGYFGVTANDGFTEPISDGVYVNDFASRFNLKRDNETGLSIVVPFPLQEITRAEIVRAALRQFFYPIVCGSLVVEVGEGNDSFTIDDETLRPTIEAAGDATRNEMAPILKLTEWSLEHAQSDTVSVGEVPQNTRPEWSNELLPAEMLKQVREKFERVEPVAFRVPVWIRREGDGAARSYFDIFLQRESGPEAYRPVFVREGIIITDAVRRKLNGVHALVVVEDKPLATLLGDCENPAHTEWQDRSGHFKGRYKLGSSVLRFVKNSVPFLVQMLSHAQEEADPSALLDYFFLPEDSEQDQTRTTSTARPREGPETPPVRPTVNGSKPTFRIQRLQGGFSVHAVRDEVAPENLEIRVAYEIRRGNPFKRYQRADFELDKPPIQVQAHGATVEMVENRLLIRNAQNEFHVSAIGFDPERDLIVRGRAR